MWQLSSTGRVKGITGDVDINVFNGYADQWQEFLSEGVIP
jgi:lysozyme